MKKSFKLLAYLGVCLPYMVGAQDSFSTIQDSVPTTKTEAKITEDKPESKFSINYYGFIRNDIMFDTRQTVDVREGTVLMWPSDVSFDQNGKDINASSQFHMLSILSRAGIKFSMSNILNARVDGLLEGDFFGNAEGGINEFRLRHAWITLNWKTTQLGVGQYWSPLTVPEMLPGAINCSGGAPYMPFNRNPQIKLTQKLTDRLSVIATALSQRDFTSNTAPYINSSTPSANLQLQYKTDKILLGAAGHFEHIRPKLSSGTLNLASNQQLNSVTAMAYAKYTSKPVTVKAQAVLAQNAGSFIMLGGYIGYTPNDGGVEVYKTMHTQSYWIDIAGNGKTWIPGLFAGYSKNNGAKQNQYDAAGGYKAVAYGFPATVSGVGAGNGSRTINYIYRIAPRIDYQIKKLKFGFEAEYSFAQWGDGNFNGVATNNLNNIDNLRLLFATTFSF